MAITQKKKTDEGKKREVDRTKPHLSIGTIGHVDAGKSTLSSAIIKLQFSKCLARIEELSEIDKTTEEKLRGITINIKHIKFETEKRHYTLIDCPGRLTETSGPKFPDRIFRTEISGPNFPDRNFRISISGPNFPDRIIRTEFSGPHYPDRIFRI